MRDQFQYTTPIKVVRALWGDNKTMWEEIPSSPQWDETVYVWGKFNQEKLEMMGYKTRLMCLTMTEPRYSTIYDHFAHKLETYVAAEEDWGEFLFLDWDVKIIKEIDENFWNLVKKKPLQCPVYGYPSDYERKIWEHVNANPQKKWVQELDPNTRDWVKVQNEQLEKYNWRWEDLQLVPNVCFFYSFYTGVPKELMNIYKTRGVKTCVEEFAVWIWANCTLEEFIENCEPFVIRGREDDLCHFDLAEEDTMKRINSYINTKVKKEIYLKHL
jgi:hypothetical protein